MKKRVFSALLCLCLALSLLPAGAWAAGDTVTVDDVTYRLSSDGTAAVGGVESVLLYIDIPETVTGPDGRSYTVTAVDKQGFRPCSSTLTITLPETVTSIGEEAFQNCNDLQSVNIPSGVTELPDRVFEYCRSLSGVTLPDGLVSIGDYAFGNCSSLTSINLPDGLESLGMGAFQDAGLTSVTIPESITHFGGYEFGGTGIETVTVPGNMKKLFGSFRRCGSLRTVVLEEGVEEVGSTAFSYCQELTTATLSSTVKSIGQFAFSNVPKLTEVKLAEGLETIGNLAFNDCPSLTAITIPASVTTIEKKAFESVGLEYVILKGTTPPRVIQDSFPLEIPLYVPAQAVEAYRADRDFSVYDIRSMDDPAPGSQLSLSASPKRLDFGTLVDGYGSNVPEAQFITVTNTGNGVVTVRHPESTNDLEYVYVPGGHGIGTENRVEVGESLAIPFRPSFHHNPGTYTEQVTIKTLEGPSVTVEMTYTVAREDGRAGLVASPTTIDFGTQKAGYYRHAAREVMLSNITDAPVTIKTPASTQYFEVVSLSPATLDVGEEAILKVRPKDSLPGGSYNDTLTVESTGGLSVEVTLKFMVEGGSRPTGSTPFTDVPAGAWYEEAVKYVYEQGIMSGASAATFAPDAKLSRAQVAQVLYNLEGAPAAASSAAFADVAGGAWYAKAVNWAAEQGIVSGYGGGRFGPEDNVTREQLALILFNYAAYKKYGTEARGDLSAFGDQGSVSGWAEEAVKWAVGAGLLSGKTGGLLDPGGTAARSEAAKILMSFCQGVARQGI